MPTMGKDEKTADPMMRPAVFVCAASCLRAEAIGYLLLQ